MVIICIVQLYVSQDMIIYRTLCTIFISVLMDNGMDLLKIQLNLNFTRSKMVQDLGLIAFVSMFVCKPEQTREQ